MNMLPEAFAIASICGVWLPQHWQSSRLRTLYRSFTCLTLVIMLLMLISQFMALILLTKSVDDLAETSFLFLTVINACVKGLNLLVGRQRIVELAALFDDEMCIPRNDEELKVRAYFDKVARYVTVSVMALGLSSASCLSSWPLFFRGDEYVLSIPAWQPYELSSAPRYYITQTHLMVATATTLFWNSSADFVCPGFMIQICAQLQLMYRRLRCVPDDATRQHQLVKQSVQHHLLIFEMTERLEIAFTPTILSQYLLSSFVLCISVYQLTNNPSDFIQLAVMILYLGTMAVELLLFCWFGNEVTVMSLNFSEMISQMDWTNLDVSSRRGLLIMMLRSSLPICITCGPLITLSNDTYTRILKLSYSVFNVLQRTQ